MTLEGLRDDIGSQSRLMLYVLLGASACVLPVACINLANLLLALVPAGYFVVMGIPLLAGREVVDARTLPRATGTYRFPARIPGPEASWNGDSTSRNPGILVGAPVASLGCRLVAPKESRRSRSRARWKSRSCLKLSVMTAWTRAGTPPLGIALTWRVNTSITHS